MTCNMLRSTPLLLMLLALAAPFGCKHAKQPDAMLYAEPPFPVALTQIEHADLEIPSHDNILCLEAPRTIRDLSAVEHWDLSLEETVRLALMNSKVLRDLGGTVVRSPDTSATSLDPAIQETDPRFGVEAALSAFDAQLESRL